MNLPVRAFDAGVENLTHCDHDFREFGVVRFLLDGSVMRTVLLLALTMTACAPGDEGAWGICLHCDEPGGGGGGVGYPQRPRITPPRPADANACPEAGCYIAPAGSAHYLVDHGTGGQIRVSSRDPIVNIHAPAELVTLTAIAPGDSELIAESLNFDPVREPFSVSDTVTDLRFWLCLYKTVSLYLSFMPNYIVEVQIDAARGTDVRRAIDESLAGDATQPEWDRFQLRGTPGPFALTLTADSFGTRSFDFELAYESDGFEARVSPHEDGAKVCFHSFLGARELLAHPTISMPPNAAVELHSTGSNCVVLEGSGPVTLFAGAAGRSLEVDVTLPL